MESMGKKPRRRRSFTPEFKAEIVELCQRGDRSAGQIAQDFDLTETAVREWVKQAERDAGARQDGGLTSAERRELAELRRENRRLREDVEILKRATAFFALRRPSELLPVHRGGASAAAQLQAGVRAAEGLPCRLLRRPLYGCLIFQPCCVTQITSKSGVRWYRIRRLALRRSCC
jgi:transposase